MSNRSIVISLAAAAACVLALLPSAGAQAGGRTQTLRFFDKPVSITLTRPSGVVVDRPPYPQAKPVLDVNSIAYVGTHASHAKKWTASSHLQCTFRASGPPSCVSHIAIGGSQLVFSGNPG